MLAQRLRRLECGMNFITYFSNELYAFLVNGLQYMFFLIVKGGNEQTGHIQHFYVVS